MSATLCIQFYTSKGLFNFLYTISTFRPRGCLIGVNCGSIENRNNGLKRIQDELHGSCCKI